MQNTSPRLDGLSAVICDQIAEQFVLARKAGRAFDDYPGPVPETLAEAYCIQDCAIARFGGAIAGWKVGRINPPYSDQYGENRLFGPIFADSVQTIINGALPTGLIYANGFGAAEAEFMLCIGADIDPAKTQYSLDETAALIGSVHVGIEIASSPFAGINNNGPCVTISDFGNNNGLMIGAEIADWRDSGFADWNVSMRIDDIEVGQGKAASFPDGPIGSARYLLENLAARGIRVPAGTWISSGAVTGVHPVQAGQKIAASFGNTHVAECIMGAEIEQ